jgi:uncharacterized protein YbgA (DUF1722 family)/uncharacterized protein YbbK (DUF523 family)
MTQANEQAEKIPVGVSSCLLGQEVRYDGGHKHNAYLTKTLTDYFEFVPFCPELAIGMPVPRPPIQLKAKDGEIHAVGVKDPAIDKTRDLAAYGQQVAVKNRHLCGYILKKDSPSCGMERVKVYDKNNMPEKRGRGIYAAALMEMLPWLPVEEEGRLMDPRLRENFVERVFVLSRWQNYQDLGMSAAALVEFHTRHKFIIQAHDEVAYRELGRLVSDLGNADMAQISSQYLVRMMEALKRLATTRTHANVLMHIMGFLKNYLTGDDKQELLGLIENYRQGKVPLIVPITLIKHYLRIYPDDYINQQYYLNPHPMELMLRNHI